MRDVRVLHLRAVAAHLQQDADEAERLMAAACPRRTTDPAVVASLHNDLGNMRLEAGDPPPRRGRLRGQPCRPARRRPDVGQPRHGAAPRRRPGPCRSAPALRALELDPQRSLGRAAVTAAAACPSPSSAATDDALDLVRRWSRPRPRHPGVRHRLAALGGLPVARPGARRLRRGALRRRGGRVRPAPRRPRATVRRSSWPTASARCSVSRPAPRRRRPRLRHRSRRGPRCGPGRARSSDATCRSACSGTPSAGLLRRAARGGARRVPRGPAHGIRPRRLRRHALLPRRPRRRDGGGARALRAGRQLRGDRRAPRRPDGGVAADAVGSLRARRGAPACRLARRPASRRS